MWGVTQCDEMQLQTRAAEESRARIRSHFRVSDASTWCHQGLKCAGSQRVADPALSNVPGLCRVSLLTASPLVRLQWLNQISMDWTMKQPSGDGQQAHLGFVTVTDTQQVALRCPTPRYPWTTWEVERRRLPSSSSCSSDAAALPGSAGIITASTISSSVWEADRAT